MSDIRPGFIEKLAAGLVPVLAIQPGICPTCRSATKQGYDSCYVCDFRSLRPVLPISLSIHGGLLHTHLRGYKDGRSEEVETLIFRLASLVSLFLEIHQESGCIPEFDLIATVPSGRRDAPRAIVDLLSRYCNRPNPLGFVVKDGRKSLEVVSSPGPARVLLMDDTFTSGNSMGRAEQALVLSGLNVVDRIVIGRHVNQTRLLPASRRLPS